MLNRRKFLRLTGTTAVGGIGLAVATAPKKTEAASRQTIALRNGPSSDRTMTVAHLPDGGGPNDYLRPGEYGYMMASIWIPRGYRCQLWVPGVRKYVKFYAAKDKGRWVNPPDVPKSTWRLKHVFD